jgi:peptide deformylase
MKIYVYGSPVLRKKAAKITKVDKKLEKIIHDMFITMENNEPRGVGLAATQVGLLQAFFVYELEDDKGVVINPEIVEKRGETEKDEEGCLSVPGVYGIVERPTEIVVTYLDLNGKRHEEVISGLKARIFQHETDHLNGIIFTDYINDIEELEVEDGYELPEALVKKYIKA